MSAGGNTSQVLQRIDRHRNVFDDWMQAANAADLLPEEQATGHELLEEAVESAGRSEKAALIALLSTPVVDIEELRSILVYLLTGEQCSWRNGYIEVWEAHALFEGILGHPIAALARTPIQNEDGSAEAATSPSLGSTTFPAGNAYER